MKAGLPVPFVSIALLTLLQGVCQEVLAQQAPPRQVNDPRRSAVLSECRRHVDMRGGTLVWGHETIFNGSPDSGDIIMFWKTPGGATQRMYCEVGGGRVTSARSLSY